MNTQPQKQFMSAVYTFAAAPSAETLLLLNKAAIPLMELPNVTPPAWKSVDAPDALSGDFAEIRVLADRRLDGKEVSRLSGCLGYALRQSLAGEDLSEPSVFCLRDHPADTHQVTVLEYAYDSTKSQRDDPDFAAAFDLAQEYVMSGSPVRTTNRAGAGSKGTRLVDGIAPCLLAFQVR